MAIAPSSINTPSGYTRVDSGNFTYFIKGYSKSPTEDFVYLGKLGFKNSNSSTPGRLWKLSEASNFYAAAGNTLSSTELYDAISSYSSVVPPATDETDSETSRLKRQNDSLKEAQEATDHRTSELEGLGVSESPEETPGELLPDRTAKSPIDDNTGLDPISGRPINALDPAAGRSSDSDALKSFSQLRDEYLKGNTDADPAVLFELTSISSIDRALGQTMRGLNMLRAPTSVPSNKDSKGYIFFTRPQLNLQDSNIANHRKFYPLLSDIPTSIQRQIRGLLDPRIQRGLAVLDIPGQGSRSNNIEFMKKVGYSPVPLDCPFVDPKNPFIPILTNTCESMSGFPDLALNTFGSKPGMHKESYVQYDDLAKTAETIDIECSFRGVLSDPITWLFYIWELYGALVFEGILMPYMDYIGENWIDYQTRIWRLVMDKSNTYVTKIAATGPAIPISLPLGTFFDFDVDSPYSDQNKSISVRFRCMGVEALDDVLVDDFNRTTLMFNPEMADGLRELYYMKVDKVYSTMMNHLSYPYINPNTYELEWWAPSEIYYRVIDNMKLAGVFGGSY